MRRLLGLILIISCVAAGLIVSFYIPSSLKLVFIPVFSILVITVFAKVMPHRQR